ncbi:hypothetical protein F5878DRAFT_577232 [Lentinula raphanica]|uniref:BHLH domain-containing protein n=1 Tax=Lentinula raphanica TaxID=153919 RepID=A0AA38PFV1_9AGAR|nr:hypothetical protein F5878DRAFT_577232 [Lentinula raphanica]
MTLGISIPSPMTRGSPSSDDSSQVHTPVSPTFTEQLPNAVASTSGPVNGNKRKSTRRVNTAERRATHNAVERARRETLNGKFLDLAAMLPNLSQIRRPSKSAIVNSSIAHIHASRRHRMLASRELRQLKVEADALRRELNEWRDRAGIPHVQEPSRGDAFSMILSGEIEVLPVPDVDEEDGEPMYGNEDGVSATYVTRSPNDYHPLVNSNVRPDIPRSGFDVSVASPGGMVVENPAMGMMYGNVGSNNTYTIPFATDLDSFKWRPDVHSSERAMDSVSRRSSLATSDVRRTRDRAMSASTSSSSGSGSPVHMTYYDPGWNATMGGMAPNMGANMGMMGGSQNQSMTSGRPAFTTVV